MWVVGSSKGDTLEERVGYGARLMLEILDLLLI
jgi:hypothetical protein